MFGNNSELGGAVMGLYYLERILDIIIRIFEALTGKKSSATTTPVEEAPEVEE